MSDDEIYNLRTRVIQLEAQVNYLYQHLGITFTPQPQGGDDPRIIDALRKGKEIDAIKIHRELYNSSLVEAKKAVEAIRARTGY